MALEALASNELSNYICKDGYINTNNDSFSVQELGSSETIDFFPENGRALNLPLFPGLGVVGFHENWDSYSSMFQTFLAPEKNSGCWNSGEQQQQQQQQTRKKRRRRPRRCKNREEAESQRMTHIAVERNRRKQMNEHLAMLRSLMPESYIQRGDQASIVGGAIDFVKELEQLLQSLEAQKRSKQEREGPTANNNGLCSPPFAQFFAFPQYSRCQIPDAFPAENQPVIADIEVTMIETHANLRILCRRRPGQLFRMVVGFQNLQLTILHLNVTTLDSMVLYSFSAKVEEECHMTSVDEIAAAVHHMLRIIEEETGLMG